ncbi:PilZ domain-containing protein [Thermopirellula anaerolimosa]
MVFSASKRLNQVRSFVLKFVNNHAEPLSEFDPRKRNETRVRINTVVVLIPYQHGRPELTKMFSGFTKDWSTTGMSVILSEPRGVDRVIVGVRFEAEIHYILATAIHLSPIGPGFYQLGLRFSEMLRVSDFPELADLVF